MESLCLMKHKRSLLIFMMLLVFMVDWIQGTYVELEDERKALLHIKASLADVPNIFNVEKLLPTWVDHGGKHCEWERVKCNTTFGYVTDLSLGDMFSMTGDVYWLNYQDARTIWPLNISLFLHFKDLKTLDLSRNYIHNTFMHTGIERLSSLKKLEMLNLSFNFIETTIFSSLSMLTSLKNLDLSYTNGPQGHWVPFEFLLSSVGVNGYKGIFSSTHDISEFGVPENLEVLNLSSNGYCGTLQTQGSESASISKKLKILILRDNQFNESLVTSLSAFGSLQILDVSYNLLSGLFPSQELSHLIKLEKLDLGGNTLDVTPSIQGCKRLMRLERLESISLWRNKFNNNIISCLSFLPSLKILHLSDSHSFDSPFPMQELSFFKELTTLDLINCGLTSLTLNGTIMGKLQFLYLDDNDFDNVDDTMASMAAFPSLRYLSLDGSFSYIEDRERPFPKVLPDLPNLEAIILSGNNFNGTLPVQALASFHGLKVIDFRGNYFVGSIPSTIKSLSFLKAISLSSNNLNGSLPDGFCDLRNLRELDLKYNMFDGNLPTCFNRLSSLKYFDISSNQFTGIIQPSLILNLTSLEYLDFSHNKFEGSFSFSLFANHSKLKVVTFISDNDMFEVETEEPLGWTPMFELEVLLLSNCNINRCKGNVIPGFLLSQHKLRELDMSHNSFKGQLPSWLIRSNTMLEYLILSDNSFETSFRMPCYRNPYIKELDLSGNRIKGTILEDIRKFLPYITFLNLSRNFLDGTIPSSISDLGELRLLDLSHNKLFGEVPTGLFTNLSYLVVLRLSNNSLNGEILSGNLSSKIPLQRLHLENNCFTGKIGNKHMMSVLPFLSLLDISNNRFTALVPSWISNMSYLSGLTIRNNWLGGQLPCVAATSLEFLDISQNHFSGSIPSCLKLLGGLKHFYLGGNKFTGSIPKSFGNLTNVLALDIGQNYLTGKIPDSIGNLSNLRVLVMGKNKFSGYIPKQLCQLVDLSLIDLSSNFLSGTIPSCLQNITGPSYQAFIPDNQPSYLASSYIYKGDLERYHQSEAGMLNMLLQDQVMFTTKSLALNYKGGVLDIMSGLDLSCNKLTGDIPEELGLLTEIRVLNLSFNLLTGTIPANFSNLINIESLDLSSNNLTGNVPSELIKLNSLASFNVSYNNLSGRLPEMKAQFGTFTNESYEGNPLLCGPPLENDCTNESHPSTEDRTDEKWFDDHIDMASFKGSFGSALFVFVLGFVALLYINPYWRRRWLDFVEECMYTFFYLFYDFVMKPFYSIN